MLNTGLQTDCCSRQSSKMAGSVQRSLRSFHNSIFQPSTINLGSTLPPLPRYPASTKVLVPGEFKNRAMKVKHIFHWSSSVADRLALPSECNFSTKLAPRMQGCLPPFLAKLDLRRRRMSTKLLRRTGSDLSEKLCLAMDILHGADGETRNAPECTGQREHKVRQTTRPALLCIRPR